ncbi:MAG: helix-turn-helix domain-containing protein [Phycisphaerales bacterium JB039]
MDADTAAIGEQIKSRRLAQELTQGDLAERSGVSKAMICDIECGKKNPTIRLLGQLAAGLGVGISDLLDLDETPRFVSDRRAQQRTLVDPENGMERRVLSTAMLRRGIEIIEYTYPPGADCTGFPPHYHGVYEAAVVVEGRVRMNIGSDQIELGPGDSVTYAADVEHSAMNVGEAPARVIYVVDSTHARRSCAPAPGRADRPEEAASQ